MVSLQIITKTRLIKIQVKSNKNMKKVIFLWIGLFFFYPATSQEKFITLEEFLAMIKKHHPVVAQADIKLSEAEAKLLKARGAFDPKLEGNVKEKNFKEVEYYSLWKGSFTIPTWYGIDVKANYEQNEGYYLNPQNTTPRDGLWSAGVSIDILKGMLFNNRMNMVKQAKILQQKNKLERDILVNTILAEGAKTFANWRLHYENIKVYKKFLTNAQIRFEGISRSSNLGETAAIDTVETKILVRKRKLDTLDASIKLQKIRLKVSNFLWIKGVPVELAEGLIPVLSEDIIVDQLNIGNYLGNAENLDAHPELQSLEFDINSYDLNIKLKKNNLLPSIKLNYNFLTEELSQIRSFSTENYKGALKVEFPLFLRKERGQLRLAKLKRENIDYKLKTKELSLKNKIKGIEKELFNLQEQISTINEIINDSRVMLSSERRLFEVGESSIFLINSRENKLIDAQLKQNEIKNKFYRSNINLFETLRINLGQ